MRNRAVFVRSADTTSRRVLGSSMTFLATSDDTAGAMELVLVESGPGGDVIPHRHPWGEAYFVLDGEMEVQVGARVHHAGSGDFLTIPPRALHGFRVVGGPARFLHVSTGAGATAAFDDYAEVAPEAPEMTDLEGVLKVLEVNARHGIEVVVPEVG
jgi:quercetin dioxygenase-like cupin family protein